MNSKINIGIALGWLDNLLKSKNEKERLVFYDRLKELITLLLPET